jgi:hypothetical protein
MINHLAALLDDFRVLIRLENRFHQLLIIHPLAELYLCEEDYAVLVWAYEFSVDQLVELFYFANTAQFLL